MLVTLEDARIAITNKILALHSTWSDYPLQIEFQNMAPVNVATQVNPYLRVTILYQDGMQIELAENPGHRKMGTLLIEALCKEGSGTSKANKLIEHFYPSMQMTDSVYPVRLQAARPVAHPPRLGWFAQAVVIPFWFDSIAP